MPMKTQPLSPAIGMEILGLDLSKDRDSKVLDEIYAIFLEHGLIAFRGQNLTPEAQIAFSGRFGTLDIHPMEEVRHKEHPELIVLKNETQGQRYGDSGKGAMAPVTEKERLGMIPWHSDLTYTAKPSVGAALYAVEVPPEGGETGFIDIAKVYDTLPEDLKQRIEDLHVIHWLGEGPRGSEADERFERVVHPLVTVHPDTGRKALNISPLFTRSVVDMDEEEGRTLLDTLVKHTTKPEFIYFHNWSVGDLLVWDNRRTMHCAKGYEARFRRVMHRTTIGGVFGAHQAQAA